ncbi:MAG: NYN domain-containing protein [Anaerolineales bacterium]|nr:NYN domain-containing protein [Anaerolineales bacterium]
MDNNYFFVDGSALLSDIKKIHSANRVSPNSLFNILAFVNYFTGPHFMEFHVGSYKRFVFYFVKGDDRLQAMIKFPDFKRPGEINDVRIEYCGKRIGQTKRAREWLDQNNAPNYVREHLYRSEKAVDTQICCDALQLAAANRLDRLFLYTNDYDYVPLCQTLRRMGSNVNLFRIRSDSVNSDLVSEFDAFHTISDNDLHSVFIIQNPSSTL